MSTIRKRKSYFSPFPFRYTTPSHTPRDPGVGRRSLTGIPLLRPLHPKSWYGRRTMYIDTQVTISVTHVVDRKVRGRSSEVKHTKPKILTSITHFLMKFEKPEGRLRVPPPTLHLMWGQRVTVGCRPDLITSLFSAVLLVPISNRSTCSPSGSRD